MLQLFRPIIKILDDYLIVIAWTAGVAALTLKIAPLDAEAEPDRIFPATLQIESVREIPQGDERLPKVIRDHASILLRDFGNAPSDVRFIAESERLRYYKGFGWELQLLLKEPYSLHMNGTYLVRYIDQSLFYTPLITGDRIPHSVYEVTVPPISKLGDRVIVVLSIESKDESKPVPEEQFIRQYLKSSVREVK